MSPAARALRQLQASGFTTPSSQAQLTAGNEAPPQLPPPRSSLKSDQDLARLLSAFGAQQAASGVSEPPSNAQPAPASRDRSLSELRAAQQQRSQAKNDSSQPNTGLQRPLPPPRSSSLSGRRDVSAPAVPPQAEGLLRSAAAHTPHGSKPTRAGDALRLTLPSASHPARWLAVGLNHHAGELVDAIGLPEATRAVLSVLQQGEADCQGPLVDLLGDGCFDFIAALVAGRAVLLAHAAGIDHEASSAGRGGDSPHTPPAPSAEVPLRQLRGGLVRQVSATSVGSAYSLGQGDDAVEYHGDLFQDTCTTPTGGRRRHEGGGAAAAAPSMSPAQLADTMDTDASRRRASALSELMNSEAGYIARLLRLVGVFLVPSAPKRSKPEVQSVQAWLKGTALDLVHSAQEHLGAIDAAAVQQPTRDYLSPGEHKALFRDVQELLPLHFTLLQHLVSAAQEAHAVADQTDFLFGAEGEGGAAGSRLDCVTPHTAPYVCVGALVELCARSFARAYAPYVAGHGQALQLLGDLTGGNTRFTEWLRSSEAACGGQTLQSFLIMPVQRIPRYALLLKEVAQATPEQHPEHPMLMSALDTSKQAAQRINSAVAEVAEREKVGALQAALAPAPSPSLVSAGARIVKCGWLDKITGGTGAREYLVVLLPTRLVYASVSRASEALLEHRAMYKGASQRLGDPNTRPTPEERDVLQQMRSAYRAAEDAAGGVQGGAAAAQHAQQVWAQAQDPSCTGVLPNTPPPLQDVNLSLHNSILLSDARARTVQGKPALRIDGSPKCITLVFDSTAERDEWAYACRAMLQKASQLADAATLGEGGYASVWGAAS